MVSGELTATSVPPCTYLCSCFPTASVTTMPFSICFVSFPGPLRPANPGRRQRKGVVVPRANAKIKGKENVSLRKEMAENLAARKLRKQALLCRGHQQAPGWGVADNN